MSRAPQALPNLWSRSLTQSNAYVLGITSPPDTVPDAPPVQTRVQELPFSSLSWENFERLCFRLTAHDGEVEHCARYGRQGDLQEGIDVFARLTGGKYHCLQAKRHRSFDARKIRAVIDKFVNGSWARKSSKFTLIVQSHLGAPKVQLEIEEQSKRLAKMEIAFYALDGDGLTQRLRDHPRLVDDFFGRSWVEALLGKDAADQLGARLDGDAFARVRAQLARYYESTFQFIDPGSFGSITDEDGRPALSLLERFVKTEILVREAVRLERAEPTKGDDAHDDASSGFAAQTNPAFDNRRPADAGSRTRRVTLTEWLGVEQRLVLLGEAGSGKSTLLRVIALDLLRGQSHFPELATRWGQFLPIYIPFARWSSLAAREGNSIGIKDIVRHSIDHFLTGSIVELLDRAINERRVLLLVDGLDEWSNEQAARATLGAIVATAETHDIPIVVSGRPRGLSRIGALPASWKRGTVAPLSLAHQATIASRWFDRFGTHASTVDDSRSEGKSRTARFMGELRRDANLGVLATVPLLLVGLVTLALRGQILPRTRNEVYDQLVRVLLEVHPSSRAVASGATAPQFRHAEDPEQRRAALARLAFAVRDQSAGGGIALAHARALLKDYFASPEGFELPATQAVAAAAEMLSINSETQGLIVETSPEEVGFVHASFDEYLAAEYIYKWPFNEIEVFTSAHAGEARWRNVLFNLICRIQRRDEFDRLIAIIEQPALDEIAAQQRQYLLGDIAFGVAMRAPATIRRLALSTIRRVEDGDWLPARREALASSLKGLVDPALRADAEAALRRWVPARNPLHRAELIAALSTWEPCQRLQDVLLRGIRDEEGTVRRASAAAYAKLFKEWPEASNRIIKELSCTRSLATAVAILESLALGWPHEPNVASLFDEARLSKCDELVLIGILGCAERGVLDDEGRDFVLHSQSFWSDVSYQYQHLAAQMTIKYWPNKDELIVSALRCVSGDRGSTWELGAAKSYLLESDVERPDVRKWILHELQGKYPFNVLGNDHRIWWNVGRFSRADPEIRAAAIAYWLKPDSRIVGMYKLVQFVKHVPDEQIAMMLAHALEDKDAGFNRYWAFTALIAGWGATTPIVRQVTERLLSETEDGSLDHLVSLLPEVISDKNEARQLLLRIGRRPGVRRDLLARGLEACGCNGMDNEAVETLLEFAAHGSRPWDACDVLFTAFPAHPRIHRLALDRLAEPDESLSSIAIGYRDDAEIAQALVDMATPLPLDLRAQVVDVAAAGVSVAALESVLAQAMAETDEELRVQMVIAGHQALRPETYEAAKRDLLAYAMAVGPNYPSVRAAALAGLTTIGALADLKPLMQGDSPLPLETQAGHGFEGIPSVERLICERFSDFEAVFGTTLPERFTSMGTNNRLQEILCAAPSSSPAARAAFLAIAEDGSSPLTPRGLRMLAAERPNSDLLFARCMDALVKHDSRNDRANTNAEVALLLRDQFPNSKEMRQRLVEMFLKRRGVPEAVTLAVFDPTARELPFPIDIARISGDFGVWTAAIHVASARADSVAFCNLLKAMITRRLHSRQFDVQRVTNLAVDERLRRDAELEELMSAHVRQEENPSICGSFTRYLAIAGRLNSTARGYALDRMRELVSEQHVPIACYDAVADEWRTLRAVLLDAASAGLEAG